MTGWQPIETAPRDGTTVDLWLVDEEGRGRREADAWFEQDGPDDRLEWRSDSGWKITAVRRSGWRSFDAHGDADWCDDPDWFNAHPMANKVVFIRATHWMPLPGAPA